MAEDLRHVPPGRRRHGLAGRPCGRRQPPPGSTLEAAPLPPTSRRSDSDQRPIKIVPKGLRSFDEHDADFFLELLPGPRDRDGLPESIRFWKTRIEQIDPDVTFKVGLIYGPSGCGKSSLVKAGLLPRLAKHVLPVYVEATAGGDRGPAAAGACARRVPTCPRDSGLVDSLAALRRGRVLPSGQKVLLVLDQFEQWLHRQAGRGEHGTGRRPAAVRRRACPGDRDGAGRFLAGRQPVHAGPGDPTWSKARTSPLVDLFDPRHARKVLTAFGRAYGTLAREDGDDLQGTEGVPGSSRSRAWPRTARSSRCGWPCSPRWSRGSPGPRPRCRRSAARRGRRDVPRRDLQRPDGHPEHRLHQKAAQAVLKALLPETGTDIKGQMRSDAGAARSLGLCRAAPGTSTT